MTTNECCRSCNVLSNHENSSHLYETTINNIKLSDMFINITSISIKPRDGLPEIICECCQTLLISAYEFRQKCIEIDKQRRIDIGIFKDDYSNSNDNNDMLLITKSTHSKIKYEEDETEIEPSNILKVKLEPIETSVNNNTASASELDDDDDDTCNPDLVNDESDDYDDEDNLPLKVITKKTHIVKRKTNRQSNKNHYKCHQCDKIFPKPSRLKRHIRVHDPTGKPYECKTCKHRFANESNLIRHEIKHSALMQNSTTFGTERKFPCTECQETFEKQQSLASHMKVHKSTDQTEFPCKYCAKIFTNLNSRRKHMKFHDEEKLNKCHICNQMFGLGSHLIDHMIKKHEGIKPFVCPHCSKGQFI